MQRSLALMMAAGCTRSPAFLRLLSVPRHEFVSHHFLLRCINIENYRPHLLVFALPQQPPILSSQQLPHHHNGHHQQASHLHLGHHYISKNHLFWFLSPQSSRRLATSSLFLCQAKQPKSLAEQVMADKVDSAKKEKGGRDNSEEQAKTEMPRSIESIEIFF